MKNFILYILSCFFLISCSELQQLSFNTDRNPPVLLGQVVTKEGAVKSNVEIKGIPKNVGNLQVSVQEKALTGTVKAHYEKSISSNETTGIPENGSYIAIEIIDDIEFAKALNEDQTIRRYIQQAKKAGAITQINAVSSGAIPSDFSTAYLENLGSKEPTIVFYQADQKLSSFSLSNFDVFDYQVSYFCYGLDERNQIAVLDIVEEGKRCKRPLERKVKNVLSTKRLVDY